ncbi:TPA: 50S ribosomal protein L35 [Candidatus Falkowbacteria bacterium]|jgi:ribosomal protein L35|nr:MAG: 50S ribosomal protein L35 [Candidatus Falkowbacteria bacterium GW2011_GWF2_43_32]HBA37076.1 50S ribosomal protein L35 [Candidatus Falkowbacteria bacterium]
MPKIKTHKATGKRFTRTATKKLKQRKAGQDHFNSRDTGNATRKKRLDISTHKTLEKTIKMLTPYN